MTRHPDTATIHSRRTRRKANHRHYLLPTPRPVKETKTDKYAHARTVPTMTALTAARRRTRRGVQFLELAIVFPFLMFFLVLTLDIGMGMLQYGALQDVAYASARAGAAAGGAQFAGSTEGGVSLRVLRRDLETTPGMKGKTVIVGSNPDRNQIGYDIQTGATCTQTGQDNRVTITLTETPNMLTPGLGSILSLIGGNSAGGEWTMHATAIARCEVIRG